MSPLPEERSLRLVHVNQRRPPLWMRVSAAVLLGVAGAAQTIPQNTRTLLDRAVASFAAGRVAQLITGIIAVFSRIPEDALRLLARFSIALTFWLSGQTKGEGVVADPSGRNLHRGMPRRSESAGE